MTNKTTVRQWDAGRYCIMQGDQPLMSATGQVWTWDSRATAERHRLNGYHWVGMTKVYHSLEAFYDI